MTEHRLVSGANGKDGFTCVVCGCTWEQAPGSRCPGARVYAWGQVPSRLKTVWQLRQAGLRPSQRQQPVGCVGESVHYLYDERQAVYLPAPTPAQLAAEHRARAARTCRECGEIVKRERDLADGLCKFCLLEVQIKYVQLQVIWWARGVLGDPQVIVLDTASTGLDYDAEIVEIALLDVQGRTLLDTLVKPRGKIPPRASALHGVLDRHVALAPTWPQVHEQVARLLRDASRVVAYDADFERRMLRQTRELYGLPALRDEPLRFQCAMQAHAGFCGQWSYARDAFVRQPLVGGTGRALGNCRATLELIRRMSAAGSTAVKGAKK